jgi:hypothetical protein
LLFDQIEYDKEENVSYLRSLVHDILVFFFTLIEITIISFLGLDGVNSDILDYKVWSHTLLWGDKLTKNQISPISEKEYPKWLQLNASLDSIDIRRYRLDRYESDTLKLLNTAKCLKSLEDLQGGEEVRIE